MVTTLIEIRNIPCIVNTPTGDTLQFLKEIVEVPLGANEVEFRKNMYREISIIREKHGLPHISEHEVEHPDMPKSHWTVHRRLGRIAIGYWGWVYSVLTKEG